MRAAADDFEASLVAELSHRFANSLQFLVSMLERQARTRAGSDAEAPLLAAVQRVRVFGAIHGLLATRGRTAEIAARGYLQDLGGHLAEAYLADRKILCHVAADDARLPAETCQILGCVVSELVLNAAKHAFPDGRTGTVTIRLTARPAEWRCSVADDGVGIARHAAPSRGIGQRLVHGLASRLGGTCAWQVTPAGTAVELVFPQANDAQPIDRLRGVTP